MGYAMSEALNQCQTMTLAFQSLSTGLLQRQLRIGLLWDQPTTEYHHNWLSVLPYSTPATPWHCPALYHVVGCQWTNTHIQSGWEGITAVVCTTSTLLLSLSPHIITHPTSLSGLRNRHWDNKPVCNRMWLHSTHNAQCQHWKVTAIYLLA
jgi:hypothetical protein